MPIYSVLAIMIIGNVSMAVVVGMTPMRMA